MTITLLTVGASPGTFARLCSRLLFGHYLPMITFEQFVESLGDYAKQYTPEQLQRLHVDVQRLAQVVIAIHRARERIGSDRSPQRRLDNTHPDRTLNENTTIP